MTTTKFMKHGHQIIEKNYNFMYIFKKLVMKKSIYLVLFVFTAFFSCTKDTKNTDSGKLSFAEARVLIKEWVFNDYNPNMNPSFEFFLDEITTDEIWSKMNAQVFTILTEVPGLDARAVFIKNNKVFDLGRRNIFGAIELDNLLVTDLDEDNFYEICFILIHGSAILRTNIVCYINDLNDKILFADTTFISTTPFNNKLKLVRENYQNLVLKQINNDGEVIIGKIILVNENNTLKLKLIKQKYFGESS